ncbi:acetoin utilization protein AcuC [Bacillus sp. FSL W7-1360]
MKKEAALIYSGHGPRYAFHDQHPFHPIRLEVTYALLCALGAVHPYTPIFSPYHASEDTLSLVHDRDYIAAVQKGGKGILSEKDAAIYGLNTEDTQIFPHMHEAASYLVGGTLRACDAVLRDEYEHAFHLGGGLHHGLRGRASGFCIYNDAAIAIAHMRQQYDVRILYVDTDAHHGDGVQWAFYNDPNVCTISIHETGRYLFPGTGHVIEKGVGQGYGTTINIPLDAYTDDDSFLSIYETAFQEVVSVFKPDIILTQNGVDAHYYDPLSHLRVSMKTYKAIPKLAHELAHQYCDGRWVALCGGGYDHWRVVPRAWSLIWLEMTNQTALTKGPLPEKWIQRFRTMAITALPTCWDDEPFPTIARQKEVTAINEATLEKALSLIRRKTSHIENQTQR